MASRSFKALSRRLNYSESIVLEYNNWFIVIDSAISEKSVHYCLIVHYHPGTKKSKGPNVHWLFLEEASCCSEDIPDIVKVTAKLIEGR